MRYIKFAAAILSVLLLASCSETVQGEEHNIGSICATEPESTKSVGAIVTFGENSAEIYGSGAQLTDGCLVISAPGSYTLTGEFYGGVTVEVTKEEKVELILSGANIVNENGSAIYVKSADKVTITLADGTENSVIDGETYALAEDAESDACIYSADDLEIGGSGTFTVYAKCRNGIQTKNDLVINGGNITVSAPNNALKGKDSVAVYGGNLTVTGAKDGIKSDNETEEGRGCVSISGGSISLTCQDDGVQAFRSVQIYGNAKLYIDAGDKQINCDGDIDVADGCLVENME